MWEHGMLNVENQNVSYSMKVFEEPSKYGINGEEFPSLL